VPSTGSICREYPSHLLAQQKGVRGDGDVVEVISLASAEQRLEEILVKWICFGLNLELSLSSRPSFQS
jgi:hypothetical protein